MADEADNGSYTGIFSAFLNTAQEMASEYMSYDMSLKQIQQQDQLQTGEASNTTPVATSTIPALDTTKIVWGFAGLLVALGLIGLIRK